MRYGCAQCREELTLGPKELSHLARARLAAHLGGCDACRAHAARWSEAMGAARAWVPAPAAAERDAILDRICARREPARPASVPARRGFAAGLLAAGALVGLVLARVGGETVRAPNASSSASSSAARSSAARADAPPAVAPGPRVKAEVPPQAGDTPPDQVRAGPAVVRTAPEPPDDRARPDTAVKRRVRRAAPAAARAGGGSTPSAPVAAPVAAARPPSPAPAAPPERPRRASAAEQLYLQAEGALEQGRPAAAARILEELVEAAPDAPEAQAARLELGRLYAGPLGFPSRAVVHLSAFVAGEREPSARTAARVLLCRLVAPAERERICWPGLALRR